MESYNENSDYDRFRDNKQAIWNNERNIIISEGERGEREGKSKNECRALYPVGAPDLDNLLKFMMDKPMQGILYSKDSAIVRIVAEKKFDDVGTCHQEELRSTCSLSIMYVYID